MNSQSTLEKLQMNKCSITEEGCAALSSALCSNPSHLIELDLSENQLGDSGVKKICSLLRKSNCKLSKLNLSFCNVTEGGYTALSSALKSNSSSHLVELDLRGNDPGHRGVKMLTDLVDDPNSKLKTLRLLNSSTAEEFCDSLTKALGKNALLLRKLDLSGKIQGDSGMKKLSDLLEDSHCRITKLLLTRGSITEEGCAALASALCSNPSHLIELDLSENQLGDSGVKKICSLLKNLPCKLKKLNLSFCSLTEEGYVALASALKSSPSPPLTELDLRGNNPGDTGVKILTDIFGNSRKTLRLLKSSDAEEACTFLNKSLGQNPLLQRELNLSRTELKDIKVKQLCALLEDPHYRLEKLTLDKSGSITERDCADLISALILNPSHLRELDLSENKLHVSGVQKLFQLLVNPRCKLEKLILTDCKIQGDGYADLTSALKSNPSSHLIELDLRGNDPGDTGVKNLTDLLGDSNCKLKTLRLLKSSTAEEVCDSLTKVLGTKPLLLRELDLSGKIQGDSEMKKISDLLKDSHCRTKTLNLNKCSITEEGCAALSSALCSNPSHLIELDLSDNQLGDSGVKKICSLLNNQCCELQKLKLICCSITEDGYAALASALKSNPLSHLIELDLRGNDPGDTGVRELTDLIEDSNCKLKTLRLLKSDDAEEACEVLNKSLGKNPLLQRELDLSRTELKDIKVKQLCALLEDPHYRLEKITLRDYLITDEDCAALASAFKTNSSHLRELDLTGNKIGNSGVKQISELLTDTQSNLEKLNLSFCSVTDGGFAALASALKSNCSSHLIELDLRGNDFGQIELKELIHLIEDSNCKLKTLRLLNSSTAEEVCDSLTTALGINPLLLTELDLSGKIQGDTALKNISDLLKDSHYRIQKLKLNKCSITEEGCAALSSALCSNPSHLIELDLSENQLGNSGVNKICSLLNNQCCELQKLNLSFCSITEEGYAALGSALKSKPSSHLIELDLRGNDPGDTGVKELTDIFMNSKKTLRLLNSDDAEEAWKRLNEILGRNPLLQRELDLSMKVPNDIQVKQLCALLQDPHYRLEKLKLNKCSITEEGCAALSSALCSNPSHLIELDLSENKLGNSGVKNICSLLNNQCCELQKLNLSFCSITEEGYAALGSALKSKPSSHLIELDLRGNDPGDTGVKELTDIFVNSKKTLRLLNSDDAEEAWKRLNEILGRNPLLQRELDLSMKVPNDIQVKQLCPLLQDPHYRLEKLKLYKSGSVKGDRCADLVSALIVNPSHLRELDLNENKLNKSGVEKLCILLKNPDCKLEKLKIKKGSIEEEGCAALASALTSNPSYLRELHLYKNKLGKSGVENLCNLLKNPHCKLENLKLVESLSENSCAALVSALCGNPSYIRDLNLNKNKLDESGVKELCNLLKNPHCKLEKLKLANTMTEKSCAALVSALCENPSYIRDLDLTDNKLRDSGMKKLCDLLKNQDCKLQKLLIKNCSIGDKGCAALTSAVSSHHLQLKLLDLRWNKLGESVIQQLSEIMKKSQCSLRLDAPMLWSFWLPSLIWNKVETEESSEDEEAHHMTAEVHTEVDQHKQ
uniref:Uncharacterized protein n=1 Tax=Pygocentrus nattereri TaxID=42514 RepID=A0A3B4EBY9_PYGNA